MSTTIYIVSSYLVTLCLVKMRHSMSGENAVESFDQPKLNLVFGEKIVFIMTGP